MTNLLRRLRGVTVIGLTWGTWWAAFGALTSVVIGIFDPGSIDPGEGPVRVAAIMGTVGIVSGVVFGSLLSIFESRRTIRDIPLIRAVMWGVLGSAALPLLTSMSNATLTTTCPLGAVSAAASVALARGAASWRRRTA